MTFDLLFVVIEELGPSEVVKVDTSTLLLETSGSTTDEIIAIQRKTTENSIRLLRIWTNFSNKVLKRFFSYFIKCSSFCLSNKKKL